MWNKTMYAFSVIAVFVGLCGILVAVIQPYKSPVYNTVDTILISSLGLLATSISSYFVAAYADPNSVIITYVTSSSFSLIPLLYILGYFGFEVWAVKKLPQRLFNKVCGLVPNLCKKENEAIDDTTNLIDCPPD